MTTRRPRMTRRHLAIFATTGLGLAAAGFGVATVFTSRNGWIIAATWTVMALALATIVRLVLTDPDTSDQEEQDSP